jgi:class 3 adenylate cyclase
MDANNAKARILQNAAHEGTVVFADASGFTALTERLAERDDGAEELCRILNNFLALLLRIVLHYGGDVIKFSGDAVTILWPAGDESEESLDLSGTVVRACHCCLRIELALIERVVDPSEGAVLTLHTGLGAGAYRHFNVGGLMGRWEFGIAGPVLTQIGAAEGLAKSGETVISPEAWALTDGKFEGTPQPAPHESFVTIKGRAENVVDPTWIWDSLKNAAAAAAKADAYIVRLLPRHTRCLLRYIPATVHRHVRGLTTKPSSLNLRVYPIKKIKQH